MRVLTKVGGKWRVSATITSQNIIIDDKGLQVGEDGQLIEISMEELKSFIKEAKKKPLLLRKLL